MPSLKITIVLLLTAIACSAPSHSRATIKLDGYLIAEDVCPAVRSIKKGTNPGNLTLTPGMAYAVIGKNKGKASHYLVRIHGEELTDRWVPINCGLLLTDCTKQRAEAKPTTKNEYLLAVSWQPSFCQRHQQKTECITQTETRFDATHLSLHGLWPQPRNDTYCNVSDTEKSIDRQKQWASLPSLELPPALFDSLRIVMPGVASHLQRHEWIKHGTCYSDSPETYYRDSLTLMQQLNDSTVQRFFAENIGKSVTAKEIRAQFDQAFGDGSGDKVNIRCDERKKLISELWINLRGEITEDSSVAALLQNAPSVGNVDCKRGIVDPAGF